MEAKPYKIPHPFRKLNKTLIDKIVKDIDSGSNRKLASEANGITARIFDIWQEQGRIDVEHEMLDTLPAYLVLSLAKVKQKEVIWCRNIIKDDQKGHKGAEWTLEHAHWRDYGGNAQVVELAADIEKLKEQQIKRTVENGKVDNEETE